MPCKRITFTLSVCVYDGPPMPGFVQLIPIKEFENMLVFKLLLPPPGAADVTSRELSVAVGDQPPVLLSPPVGAAEVEDASFRGADDTPVAVTLVDVDDAANRSEARVQSFVLTDTIAPPAPGEIGLVVTAEE